jgi:type VI secretion system protein ImpG
VSFNKYYEDELVFLQEMGAEFAEVYPQLAPFLRGRGNDPDVERLLEGFAFLTGRIRQKLDDELPELTHSLVSLLWPHYLRPIPAMSILQLQPKPYVLSEPKRVPRGTEVAAVPVEGISCRFQTCYDVDLYPLTLEEVHVERVATGALLKLEFALDAGVTFDTLELETLRLYFHGEPFISQTLYLWLRRYVTKLTVRPLGRTRAARPLSLPPTAIKPVGFGMHEGLLPYPPNSFVGYRLLQEYFTLPQKFLFVDITGLAPTAQLDIDDRFEIVCEFSHPLEDQVRANRSNVLLYCTPMVNLFPQSADPIRLQHDQTEYRIRPAGGNLEHTEIYSVDRVSGWVQGSGEERTYASFLSPQHSVEADDEQGIYYRSRLVPAVIGRGVDTTVSFVTAAEKWQLPQTETISIDLTCTNRHVPERLRAGDPEGLRGERPRVGDISVPTASSPEFADFHNILPLTPSLLPPVQEGLLWQLISNMSLNYISLVHEEALRAILTTYNFRAFNDRQAAQAHRRRMEGLGSIRTKPLDLLLRGSPIRGLHISMEMRESQFSGEGDLYLFASVLNEFFALYATINSFHRLEVRNTERGEVYRWPARIGQQPLM